MSKQAHGQKKNRPPAKSKGAAKPGADPKHKFQRKNYNKLLITKKGPR